MMFYRELQQREDDGRFIHVALIGAGSMGIGIAWQVAHTPGMRLSAVVDIDLAAAEKAVKAAGLPFVHAGDVHNVGKTDNVLIDHTPDFLFQAGNPFGIEVLVEASNSIGPAARYCEAGIDSGMHIVLMNAEVDLAFGHELYRRALEHNVVVTSDAGDQHGVLMRMLDEIQLWGFDIVMAGNIKGFLDRYATAESLLAEAQARNLNPVQCCAYTDGTKLNIEMALVANATGLLPSVPGMQGPALDDVRRVFEVFDFADYKDQGVVDYILGAEPGGGVYIVGHCDDPVQMPYLKYYKLGDGPYYLFYRPYHLCHLETTWAIASAAIQHQSVMSPYAGRVADVFAYAKRDISPGEVVQHGIGGDLFYGLVHSCTGTIGAEGVPITLLEGEDGKRAKIVQPVKKDQLLQFDHLELPDTYTVRKLAPSY